MLDRFHHPIICPADCAEPRRQIPHGLVVDRIDLEVVATHYSSHSTPLVEPDVLVPVEHVVTDDGVIHRSNLGRDVLDERPTQRDVEHLDASAYRQHRCLPPGCATDQLDLELITVEVHAVHRVESPASVPLGLDVTPAGKHETIDTIEEIVHVVVGNRGEEDRHATGSEHRIGVGVLQRVSFQLAPRRRDDTGTRGDADDRAHGHNAREHRLENIALENIALHGFTARTSLAPDNVVPSAAVGTVERPYRPLRRFSIMQVEVSNMIIVAGIDDTPHSVCVVEHGLRQAKLQNAELHIVHVFHLPPTVTAGYGIFPVDVEKLETAERTRVWDQVRSQVEGSDVEVLRVDLEGYPPDTLVAYVENVRADLLVVGTRGRGEIASIFLGSTSHRAIHLAHCDVLVVKPDRAA